jgi:hypothetical protein
MDPKSIQFDYLHDFIMVNQHIDKVAQDDNRLSEAERLRLLEVMNVIRTISNKANELDFIRSDEGKKITQEQYKSQIRAIEYNTKNIENTYETIISIKSSLQEVVRGATRAYNYIMIM